jgi:polyketide biosynthesis enoyl-CoA hydratase PksI
MSVMQSGVEFRDAADGVALVTMCDRISKNAFSEGLVEGLRLAYCKAGESDRYRALVLTGYDTYFATGATRENLLALAEGAGTFADANVYNLALDCPIPVLSAMQGHGIGGGFIMGLFSDIVILSRESIYTANFMQYGFTPGMGATYILREKLGAALAHEMLLTGGRYRGEALQQRGASCLVLPRNEVVPRALRLAEELAEKPREALVLLKRHLARPIREALPAVLEQELLMHEHTMHRAEVQDRVIAQFGKPEGSR